MAGTHCAWSAAANTRSDFSHVVCCVSQTQAWTNVTDVMTSTHSVARFKTDVDLKLAFAQMKGGEFIPKVRYYHVRRFDFYFQCKTKAKAKAS